VSSDVSRLIFGPAVKIVSRTTRKVVNGFDTLHAEGHQHQCGYAGNTREFVRDTEFAPLCIETSLDISGAALVWFGISFSRVRHNIVVSGGVEEPWFRYKYSQEPDPAIDNVGFNGPAFSSALRFIRRQDFLSTDLIDQVFAFLVGQMRPLLVGRLMSTDPLRQWISTTVYSLP
jgi:hypothetical protein